jgi:hypothetical protein
MGLLSYFVTQKVEKSNFYKDLERIIDWKESDKKNEKQNEPFEYLRSGMK